MISDRVSREVCCVGLQLGRSCSWGKSSSCWNELQLIISVEPRHFLSTWSSPEAESTFELSSWRSTLDPKTMFEFYSDTLEQTRTETSLLGTSTPSKSHEQRAMSVCVSNSPARSAISTHVSITRPDLWPYRASRRMKSIVSDNSGGHQLSSFVLESRPKFGSCTYLMHWRVLLGNGETMREFSC